MFDRVAIAFIVALLHWLKLLKERRKPEHPEKPPTTCLRRYRILKPENSSPNRDSNPHSSIDGRRLLGKQTC